jgi:hypothetical protein
LASVCAGTGPIADLEVKVRQTAEFLAEDFPDSAAFTSASVKAVAAEVQFFPPYGKLKAFLGAWWEQNRPAMPAGEPDDIDATDLPVGDKIFVRRWQSASHLAANKTALGDWVAKPWPGGVVGAAVLDRTTPALVVDLSLIRRHAPAGYRRLLRTNQQAAQIAGKMQWPDPTGPRPVPRSDEDQAASAKAADKRIGIATDGVGDRIEGGAPRPPDPEHMRGRLLHDQIEAQRGRKIGQLSREALDAAWAASKLRRPDTPEPPLPEAAE